LKYLPFISCKYFSTYFIPNNIKMICSQHYDGVTDVNDVQFKEYYCQRDMVKINECQYCACFEGKQPKLSEEVLPI
jgi:hypothetical protein